MKAVEHLDRYDLAAVYAAARHMVSRQSQVRPDGVIPIPQRRAAHCYSAHLIARGAIAVPATPAYAQTTVQRSQGSIEVSINDGKGATFDRAQRFS
jgi:hypothetical protein